MIKSILQHIAFLLSVLFILYCSFTSLLINGLEWTESGLYLNIDNSYYNQYVYLEKISNNFIQVDTN